MEGKKFYQRDPDHGPFLKISSDCGPKMVQKWSIFEPKFRSILSKSKNKGHFASFIGSIKIKDDRLK
jgi:hypothetical protein